MIRFFILLFAVVSMGACQTARSGSNNYKPYRVVKESKKHRKTAIKKKKRRSVSKRHYKSKKSRKKHSKQFALYSKKDLNSKLLRRGKAVRYSQALDFR